MNNELIYLDTNIYIDYFENRVDKLRPLGTFAFELIRKSIECEYRILISSLVLDELEFNGFSSRIKILIGELSDMNKLVYVDQSEMDLESARKIKQKRKTSFNDTKHAVIANRARAVFFVTRNMKDFEEL